MTDHIIKFNTKMLSVMDKYAGMFPESTMGGFYEAYKLKYNRDSPEPAKKFHEFVEKEENRQNFLDKKTQHFLSIAKTEKDKNRAEFISEFLKLYTENKNDKELIEDIWRDLHILFGLSRRCCAKK